jgi:hypothetical protein
MPPFGYGASTLPECVAAPLKPIPSPPEKEIQLPQHLQNVASSLSQAMSVAVTNGLISQTDAFLQLSVEELLWPGYVNKFTEPGKTVLTELLRQLYRTCAYIGRDVTAYQNRYDYLLN